MSELPTLFISTPMHSGWLHYACVAGLLQSQLAFPGRVQVKVNGGSFLPMNRDMLTVKFLESPCSHMLCLDSDIGWEPRHAQLLLDSGKDFVSGCYAKKQPNREIPARLTGHVEGDLWEAEWVPAGFLLLSRACVERMVGAYRNLAYMRDGVQCWGLWASTFDEDGYSAEDVAFCRRWRKLGEKVWLHRGVALRHYGETCFELPCEEPS